MKLTFIYAPAEDLSTTVAFYRNTLGWSEAWREGDDTVVFHIPGSESQVMVSTTRQPVGPMLFVDRVDEFLDRTEGLRVTIEPYQIPDGTVVGFEDPSGNTIYVFDQARA
jgi:predicted enzyme related to lactoylglutathione lyase